MSGSALATEAVVLRRVPYAESDLILTLYTRERGRLSALARGARSSRRRFGAALELFAVSDLRLRERPRSELWTLTDAALVRGFFDLAVDMARLAHASYGTELIRELTAPEQPDGHVFELVVEFYAALTSRAPTAHGLRAFELRLLDLLGLAPVLDACVGCGASDLDEPAGAGSGLARFDPERGGVTCARCAVRVGAERARPLSRDVRALLSHAQRAPSIERAADTAPVVPAAVTADASRAMRELILGHVGHPLRTLEFLAKLSAPPRAR